MNFEPRNILVIHFGQMGDVVLGLPAFEAIRHRFPSARITIAAGKSATGVLNQSGYADDVLSVDRVLLRDGNKLLSGYRIIKLVKDVRARKFDFVIDLNSLPETNILGFVSGAPRRLYAERITRSLDFLGNFPIRPPRLDTTKHLVERYLDVLAPLGVKSELKRPRLRVKPEDAAKVEDLFRKAKVMTNNYNDVLTVGMFPGAGHPSRQWNINHFAELARRLQRDEGVRVMLFPGPEERHLVKEYRRLFPDSLIFDRLTFGEFIAALSKLSVFVSNDTGPVHLAAATGTPVVVVLGQPDARGFQPVGEQHQIIYSCSLDDITVDEVFTRTRIALTANRTTMLFTN